VLAQDPSNEGSVSAVVEVLEVGVVADFESLGRREIRGLQASDLVVTEDGKVRDVTRITPLVGGEGGDETWSVLIYVDAALSRPGAIRQAALALGDSTRRLTALGAVDVFVAGPPTYRTNEPTASSLTVAEVLTQVAEGKYGSESLAELRLELGEAPDPDHARAVLASEAKLVRQRADILMAEAAARCFLPPCALILVSDGWWSDLSTVYPAEVLDDFEGQLPDEVADEVGRVLAALGWTVVGLPVEGGARATVQREPRGVGTDYEAYKADTGGVTMAPSGTRGVDVKIDRLEALAEPRYGTIRDWALQSAGTIAPIGAVLDEELKRLRRRWWVFFRSERNLTSGIKPIEVRFAPEQQAAAADGVEVLGVGEGRPAVRAPRWLRSSVPPELGRARARRIAVRDWLAADFVPVSNWREYGQPSIELAWSAEAVDTPIRLTLLRRGEVPVQRLVEVDREAEGIRLEIEPGNADVVVIEELLSRRWGWVMPRSAMP
jgi:hypothetical protein